MTEVNAKHILDFVGFGEAVEKFDDCPSATPEEIKEFILEKIIEDPVRLFGDTEIFSPVETFGELVEATELSEEEKQKKVDMFILELYNQGQDNYGMKGLKKISPSQSTLEELIAMLIEKGSRFENIQFLLRKCNRRLSEDERTDLVETYIEDEKSFRLRKMVDEIELSEKLLGKIAQYGVEKGSFSTYAEAIGRSETMMLEDEKLEKIIKDSLNSSMEIKGDTLPAAKKLKDEKIDQQIRESVLKIGDLDLVEVTAENLPSGMPSKDIDRLAREALKLELKSFEKISRLLNVDKGPSLWMLENILGFAARENETRHYDDKSLPLILLDEGSYIMDRNKESLVQLVKRVFIEEGHLKALCKLEEEFLSNKLEREQVDTALKNSCNRYYPSSLLKRASDSTLKKLKAEKLEAGDKSATEKINKRLFGQSGLTEEDLGKMNVLFDQDQYIRKIKT